MYGVPDELFGKDFEKQVQEVYRRHFTDDGQIKPINGAHETIPAALELYELINLRRAEAFRARAAYLRNQFADVDIPPFAMTEYRFESVWAMLLYALGFIDSRGFAGKSENVSRMAQLAKKEYEEGRLDKPSGEFHKEFNELFRDTFTVADSRKARAGQSRSAVPFRSKAEAEKLQREAEDKLVTVAKRHVQTGAREAVVVAVSRLEDVTDEDQPLELVYGRRLVGEVNCPNCVCLASRGAVYHSAWKAGFDENGLSRWHDNCDCDLFVQRRGERWEFPENVAEFRGLKEQIAARRDSDSPEQVEGGAVSHSPLDDTDAINPNLELESELSAAWRQVHSASWSELVADVCGDAPDVDAVEVLSNRFRSGHDNPTVLLDADHGLKSGYKDPWSNEYVDDLEMPSVETLAQAGLDVSGLPTALGSSNEPSVLLFKGTYYPVPSLRASIAHSLRDWDYGMNDYVNPTGKRHQFGGKEDNKTYFPEAWADEKILQAIIAVWQNLDEVRAGINNEAAEYAAEGMYEGVRIRITWRVYPNGVLQPGAIYPVFGPGVVRYDEDNDIYVPVEGEE